MQAAKQGLCNAEQLSDQLHQATAAKQKDVTAAEQALMTHRYHCHKLSSKLSGLVCLSELTPPHSRQLHLCAGEHDACAIWRVSRIILSCPGPDGMPALFEKLMFSRSCLKPLQQPVNQPRRPLPTLNQRAGLTSRNAWKDMPNMHRRKRMPSRMQRSKMLSELSGHSYQLSCLDRGFCCTLHVPNCSVQCQDYLTQQ